MSRKIYEQFGRYLKTAKWALCTAWSINSKLFLALFLLSTVIALLPSLLLVVYQYEISYLAEYLQNQLSSIYYVKIFLCLIGGVLAAIAVSNRFNDEVISALMYDSYYLGLQEMIISHAQKVDIECLLSKEFRDEYISAALYDSSLTTFMSSLCCIWGRIIGIVSLLRIALEYSTVIFGGSIMYVVLLIMVNSLFFNYTRKNDGYIRSRRTRANYYETLCKKQSAAKEIRLYEAANAVLNQWKKAYTPVKEYDNNRKKYIFIQQLCTGFIFYSFLSIVIITLLATKSAYLSLATILMLVSLCFSLHNMLSDFTRLFLQGYDTLPFLEKQQIMLQHQPQEHIIGKYESDLESKTPIFKAENLTYVYPDGTIGVNGLSFEIYEKEKIALLGANGSGKTTLVKLLLGLYTATEGVLYYKGVNYECLDRSYLFREIATYFQDCVLFHKSLRDNVAYGNLDHINNDTEIKKALNKSGSNKMFKKLPMGLDSIIGKKVKQSGVELSGGEKQRIGISRLHISDRPVFILDEPASALDPIAEVEQVEQIMGQLANKTAILISHRVGFAKIADRIMILENGEIMEDGTHTELMKLEGTYYYLYKTQEHMYS